MKSTDALLHSPLLDGSRLARQIELERECLQQGVLAYRESVANVYEAGEGSHLRAVDPLFARWFVPVRHAIRTDVRRVDERRSDTGLHLWGSVIQHHGVEGADELAAISLHETVSWCLRQPDGVRVATLAYHIGRDVMAMHMLEIAGTKYEDKLAELKEKYRDITARLVLWWGRRTLDTDIDWARKLCTHAGARLLWHVITNCDCSEEGEDFKLSFHHRRRPVRLRGGRIITPAFVEMDDRVFDLIDSNHARRAASRPRYTFMVAKPMPWTEKTSGNYVKHKTSIFIRATHEQQEHAAGGKLGRVREALNAVNATPWRINLWMLGVVQEYWERGGNMLGIPRADDIPLPEKHGELSGDELAHLRRARWQARRDNRHLKAQRIMFLRTLGTAEQFLSEPAFYQPHLMDFRGRLYARPLYLNHQGDDLRRGLLEFARARKPDGDGWLSIHAANCYGVDKVSHGARQAWVVQHFREIERCVADPMGEEFWHYADNPWQFLAACRALVDDKAAAHIPVQLDGSCNGLQHYSAMGRDETAAPLVNLSDGETPGDIYQAVADAIAPVLNRDSAESERVIRYSRWTPDGKQKIEVPVREIAGRLLDVLDRKLIKQPVMTSVYGVTVAGARQQLINRFKELEYDRKAAYEGASYLSIVVLKGIEGLCPKATEIMDWLTRCGRAVAKGGTLVCWTSPIGLPVLQAYRNYRTFCVKSIAGHIWKRHEVASAPVSVGKQADGIAPNWVHSIDASHAMMTATRCRQADIDIALVHDSYWTHAATVERMGRLCRQTFVDMHSEPLLERMHEQLQGQVDDELPPPPSPGGFDLRRVLGSTYFFH